MFWPGPVLHDVGGCLGTAPAPGATLNFGTVGEFGGTAMSCSKPPQGLGIILETSELLIINIAFEVCLIKKFRILIKPPYFEFKSLWDVPRSSSQPRVLWHWGYAIPSSVCSFQPAHECESRVDWKPKAIVISLELQEAQNVNMCYKDFFFFFFS